MVEFSKGFRAGRICSMTAPNTFMAPGDVEMPYISVVLESEIPIGFGDVVKEKTNVLFVGEAVVSWWKNMLPTPKEGDTVRISYATMYVANATLCMRVTDPSQFEVIPQETAQKAPGMDTYKTINAADYFRAALSARK